MVITMLMYEPMQLEAIMVVCEDQIELGDIEGAFNNAQVIASQLNITPRNSPSIYANNRVDFSLRIIREARKVITASMMD